MHPTVEAGLYVRPRRCGADDYAQESIRPNSYTPEICVCNILGKVEGLRIIKPRKSVHANNIFQKMFMAR